MWRYKRGGDLHLWQLVTKKGFKNVDFCMTYFMNDSWGKFLPENRDKKGKSFISTPPTP